MTTETKPASSSNPEPMPFYIAHGRMFYGLGKSETMLNFRQFLQSSRAVAKDSR